MNYTTQLTADEVVNILSEQTDSIPPFFWTRIRKNSQICGTINNYNFELRNNTYHMYSLRAYGTIVKENEKIKIELTFKKPPFIFHFYGSLFQRYNTDKKVIISFLKEWINLENIDSKNNIK